MTGVQTCALPILIPRASCFRVVSERIRKSVIGFAKAYFLRGTGNSVFSHLNPSRQRRVGSDADSKTEPPAPLAECISNLPIFVDVEKIKNTPVNVDLHKKYSQFDFVILMASRFGKEKNIRKGIIRAWMEITTSSAN